MCSCYYWDQIMNPLCEFVRDPNTCRVKKNVNVYGTNKLYGFKNWFWLISIFVNTENCAKNYVVQIRSEIGVSTIKSILLDTNEKDYNQLIWLDWWLACYTEMVKSSKYLSPIRPFYLNHKPECHLNNENISNVSSQVSMN